MPVIQKKISQYNTLSKSFVSLCSYLFEYWNLRLQWIMSSLFPNFSYFSESLSIRGGHHLQPMICDNLGSRWRWTWLLFHLPSDPRLISHFQTSSPGACQTGRERCPSFSLSCGLKIHLLLSSDSALNVKPWRYLPSHRLLGKPCKLTVWCTDATMTKYIDFTDWVFLSRSNADFLLPEYRRICTSICLCMFCTSALTHKTWTCPSVGADGNTLTSQTPSMGHTTHAGVRKDSFWSWFIPLSFF